MDNDGGDPSGTLFGWTSGYPGGNRVEWTDAQDATYGDGLRVYISPLDSGADYQTFSMKSKNGEGGARYLGNERHRLVTRIKNGEIVKYQPDNGEYRSGIKTAGSLVAPTKLGFGCRPWASGDPDNQAANMTLKCVTIYNATLSDGQIETLGGRGVASPIHLLGDSFFNNYDVLQNIEKLLTRGYVPRSQDGVGGTTLADQAIRYRDNAAKWHDATLVIGDMGFDSVTAQDAIDAINSILTNITHDRWVFLEPAPNLDNGSPTRTAYDAKMATVEAYCGAHWVPTLDLAMAESDGSAEDLAKVAARRWPTSLTVSDADFHPNHNLGAPFLGALIYDALVARGYI